jgi:hypothetical protein
VRRPVPLFAATALLAACSTGGDTDAIDLESSASESAPEALEGDDGGEQAAEDPASDGSDGDAGSPEEEPATSGDVVDGTEAVPGTWQVGDAGTVTFDVVDGALVLEDVSENEGWSVTDIEEAADEIEVDFRRDDVEVEIEIELESGGTILEIEIDTDIEDADPGTYDIGDAGSFTFEVVDGVLELTDVTATDGWDITEQDVEGDEIEIELRRGAMRWDADVDLDGSIEVELDYEVTGQV